MRIATRATGNEYLCAMFAYYVGVLPRALWKTFFILNFVVGSIVRRESDDLETRVLGAVLPQGRNDDRVRMALLGVLAAEVATEEAKLAARHVDTHPDVHGLEVAQKRRTVFASGEGDPSKPGLFLGENATVGVAREVGLVLVADVGPPRVALGGALANLHGEAIERAVGGGCAAVCALLDAVAVVDAAVDLVLPDATVKIFEGDKLVMIEDVEAVGDLLGTGNGGAC